MKFTNPALGNLTSAENETQTQSSLVLFQYHIPKKILKPCDKFGKS